MQEIGTVLRDIEDGELDVNASKSHASFFPELMLIIHNECHEHAAVCWLEDPLLDARVVLQKDFACGRERFPRKWCSLNPIVDVVIEDTMDQI